MELLVHNVDVDPVYCDDLLLEKAVQRIVLDFGFVPGEMALVFCSDDYILEVNRTYLNHDFFTDIITFDYCSAGVISGDLIVSLDTVRSNSELYGVRFELELFRVVVHGLLHLCGLGDKSADEAKNMREKEDFYFDLLVNPFVSRET
jgi:rRNA maturation RNase YbeY